MVMKKFKAIIKATPTEDYPITTEVIYGNSIYELYEQLVQLPSQFLYGGISIIAINEQFAFGEKKMCYQENALDFFEWYCRKTYDDVAENVWRKKSYGRNKI